MSEASLVDNFRFAFGVESSYDPPQQVKGRKRR